MKVGLFALTLGKDFEESLKLHEIFCVYSMFFSHRKEVAAQIILFIWFSTSFSNSDIRLKEFVNSSEANYN